MIVLAGAAVLVPRFAGSERVRAAIASASTEALGRPLRYARLEAGLWPPRVELRGVHLAGGTEAAAPSLEAERISLRLGWLALLRRQVAIDSLSVDRPRVTLVRTADGIEWAGRVPDAAAPPPPAPDDATDATDATSVDVAVSRVVVRDGTVLFIDRTASPPATAALDAVALVARRRGPAGPIAVEASASLERGGGLRVAGDVAPDGASDLRIDVGDAALAPLLGLAGAPAAADARLSGTIRVGGPLASPRTLTADLRLAVNALGVEDVSGSGPAAVALRLDRAGEGGDPALGVSIDATDMALDASAAGLRKPAGTRARVEGSLPLGGAGAGRIALSQVELAGLRGQGVLQLGDAPALELDAAPFALETLLPLVTAAADADVTGRVALRELRVRAAPLALGGVVALEAVRIGLPTGGHVDLSGGLRGGGRVVELEAFEVVIGGQPFDVAGRVVDVGGTPSFAIELASRGVHRAEALVAGYAPDLAGRVVGPTSVRGTLAGRAGADADVLDGLAGRLAIDVGRTVGDGSEGGRLAGASAVGELLQGLERAGELARILRFVPGARLAGLQGLVTDDFEVLQAHWRIGGGQATSERLEIDFGEHVVRLDGTVALASRALDMTGELELGRGALAAIGVGGNPVVVPIARVGGTLDQPEIVFSPSALSDLSGRLLSRTPRVRGLLDEADDVVPGAGRVLERGLDEIFGGGSGSSGKDPRTP